MMDGTGPRVRGAQRRAVPAGARPRVRRLRRRGVRAAGADAAAGHRQAAAQVSQLVSN